MKNLNLKTIGVATVISILAAMGYVGLELNSNSIQIEKLQFEALKNELALKCAKGEPLTIQEYQIFPSIIDRAIEEAGGVTLSNVDEKDLIQRICKSVLTP